MPQSEALRSPVQRSGPGEPCSVEVLQGWKHGEVTEYLTITPFLYNTLFFITMNLDQWNALDPEIQAAIEKVNEEYFEKVAMGLWDMQNEAALKWAVETCGMEVINLPREETDRWISLVSPVQEQYVSKMKEKGLPGQEALDLVKELAEKYNQQY